MLNASLILTTGMKQQISSGAALRNVRSVFQRNKGGKFIKKSNLTKLRALWLVSAVLLFASGITVFNLSESNIIVFSWIPGLAMLISGCINVFIYQKNKRNIHGADWLLAEGMSTALLSLFPLFNQMIYPIMIPFFFGVWELVSGLLKAIDSKGLRNENVNGWQAFAIVSILELLSGTASMIKPVDDIINMNIIIAVILFVQSIGYVIKAVYCKNLLFKI